MNGTILKHPQSELTFCLDWRAGYLTKDETLTGDLGWTVQPVEGDPACLAILHQTQDMHCSNVVLSGGVPGQVYLLTATVSTSGNRTLKRAMVLRIIDKTSGETNEFN